MEKIRVMLDGINQEIENMKEVDIKEKLKIQVASVIHLVGEIEDVNNRARSELRRLGEIVY